MSPTGQESRWFTVDGAPRLAGEWAGRGPRVMLLHGVTATRRQVVHGSLVLPRRGYLTVAYDARGHGASEPAAPGAGYGYEELVADLDRVIGERGAGGPSVIAGHSMGAHTAVAYALDHPGRVAGLVVIGPVYRGFLDEEVLGRWEHLAEGLERGGIDGFLAALEAQGISPRWRDSVLRFTRARMEEHRDLGAVARALREVPRSRPFESLDELAFCEVPSLVVASRDDADPGHPRAVAEAYAETLPQARLIGEDEGESPLAWQGGRLSREIADFCAGEAVQERLG